MSIKTEQDVKVLKIELGRLIQRVVTLEDVVEKLKPTTITLKDKPWKNANSARS